MGKVMKKEHLILIAVIVVLGLLLYFQKADQTNYEVPTIDPVVVADITTIEIKQAGEAVKLNKRDDQWFIEGKEYLVDSNRITNILNDIEKLKINDLASESKSYVRYGLDDPGKIIVKVWAGKNLVLDLEVGKSADSFQHTFIKLPQDPNVYLAQGSFHSSFNQSVDRLRDKKVFKFPKDTIAKIAITKGDKYAEYIRKTVSTDTKGENASTDDESKTINIWVDADGQLVDIAKVQGLIDRLERFRCFEYLYDRTKSDLKNPDFEIKLYGEKEYILALYKPDQAQIEAEQVPGLSSESDEAFILNRGQFSLINGSIEELINPEPEVSLEITSE
jgi:uncharacterized protein DUF4340